jgi:CPA1 family monovalent cation:H+ antiporter
MHDEGFMLTILGLCIALMIGSALYLLSRQFKSIPYTVMLVIAGMILSPFHIEAIETIKLSPEMVLYIILPILLFESAFNFDFKEFRRILTPGFLLASFGLLISAFVIAIPLSLIFNFPFIVAFFFGCVISSTDPIAVLTIFKNLGVPKRLQLLVDGESFLNDATSAVMFKILLPLIGVASFTIDANLLLNASFSFIFLLLGGAIFGAIAGYIFSIVIGRIKKAGVVEITLTIIIAHLVFILADDILKVSGIIAVLVCGLVLGNYGKSKISPEITHDMHEMWNLLVFISTSLIFLLIGYEINLGSLASNIIIIIVATFLTLVGRAVSVYPLLSLYNLFTDKKSNIPVSWMHIVNLGGLRGALPLILVLSIPESTFYDKNLIIELVIGSILFTLIFNALIMEILIKKLGINNLNQSNVVEIMITKLFVYKRMKEEICELERIDEIDDAVCEKVNNKLIKQIESLNNEYKDYLNGSKLSQHFDELEKVLRRFFVQAEINVYYDLYKKGILSERIYNRLVESNTLQIDALEEGLDQLAFTGDSYIKRKNGSSLLTQTFFDKILSKLDSNLNPDKNYYKNLYIYHKARVVGNEYILDEMKSILEGLPRQIIIKLEGFYKDLLEYNHQTLNSILLKYPEFEKDIDELFINQEIVYIFEKVLEEYRETNRISVKAIQNLRVE